MSEAQAVAGHFLDIGDEALEEAAGMAAEKGADDRARRGVDRLRSLRSLAQHAKRHAGFHGMGTEPSTSASIALASPVRQSDCAAGLLFFTPRLLRRRRRHPGGDAPSSFFEKT